MTVAVELETRIARPADTIFEALIDLERYPAWLIASGIVGVERLEAGPLTVGSRIRISQNVAGRSAVLDGNVTALDPGAAFGLRGKDKEGVTIEINAVLVPEDVATRLRWSLRLTLPLRYRVFESMVSPQARRAAVLDLEAFRRRLESVDRD